MFETRGWTSPFYACDISDVMCLAKESETVRRNICLTEEISGYFDRGFVIDSFPRSLVELMSMIKHRPDIKSQIEDWLANQILYFNSHRKGAEI